MDIKYFQDTDNIKIKFLNTLIDRFKKENLIPKQLFALIKSADLINDLRYLEDWILFRQEVIKRCSSILDDYDEMLSVEDSIYLSRIIEAMTNNIPVEDEARWKLLHRDEENVRFDGQVMIGERTLESFGEIVLEEYYLN